MIADWTMSLLLTALMATRQRSVSSQKRKRSIVGKRQCQKKENKPSSHLIFPTAKHGYPRALSAAYHANVPRAREIRATQHVLHHFSQRRQSIIYLSLVGMETKGTADGETTILWQDLTCFNITIKNFPGHFTFAIFAFALHSCPHRTSSHNQSLTARDLKRIFFYK